MNETKGYWKKHPRLVDVWLSSDGYVVTWDGRHKRWFEPRRGRQNSYGYLKTKIQKKDFNVHILICETFNGAKPGADYTVDHINGDKTDNRSSNLRWATRSQQCLNRRKAVSRRDGTPVWVWLHDCEETTAIWFPNVYAAAEHLKSVHASNLRKVARGEYNQTGGYKASFDKGAIAAEIPGEIFRPYKNIQVSQLGRMKNIHGRILTPRALKSQVYATYDNELFHCIVARVWYDIVGPDPHDPSMTVDHKNRDKSDNRACNLRWASRKEQRANQER